MLPLSEQQGAKQDHVLMMPVRLARIRVRVRVR